ncbi:helix-turn-helix domain-containing protein [Gracilibacillus thailandensis]|jgi:transcriptional regulator with XRE-family HTH domain|uniref:Helix-turn-helix domain-containing protein n=1 Tax=Gracilibacillus thailandensis TaxID=563735 RepID=A0A6N7R6A3_9BACI|nr:helix-turn-helix transcriptional regulator [Gracilibacillus thailandensis]MRI68767.1 helix-turn-helix domain-containing protein [Gracilibacillus thailandensis]
MATNRWGKRIKAFRKLKGYTQIEFADELGISVSQLGEIERGKRIPTEDYLKYIAAKLDISLEELQPKIEENEEKRYVEHR